jgi:hypothetical protein
MSIRSWCLKAYCVAILLNLLRKRRVMIKEVNVSNVRERWARMWEGESYPAFVAQGRCKRYCQKRCLGKADGKKKKSDEEAKKEQRNGLTKKAIFSMTRKRRSKPGGIPWWREKSTGYAQTDIESAFKIEDRMDPFTWTMLTNTSSCLCTIRMLAR